MWGQAFKSWCTQLLLRHEHSTHIYEEVFASIELPAAVAHREPPWGKYSMRAAMDIMHAAVGCQTIAPLTQSVVPLSTSELYSPYTIINMASTAINQNLWTIESMCTTFSDIGSIIAKLDMNHTIIRRQLWNLLDTTTSDENSTHVHHMLDDMEIVNWRSRRSREGH